MSRRFLTFVLAAPALWAQAAPPPPRVGVGVIQRKLGLDEAVGMALKNNLEIEIERTQTASAAQAIKAAQGAFDPIFRWLPSVESRNLPVASVLQGPGGKLTENLLAQNFSLLQKVEKYGTSFQAGFDNGRQTTTNSFSSLNPVLTSRIVLAFTQPLWRNRSIDRERTVILVTRKQLDISDTAFEMRVIDVVGRVEQAYWDLVAARQAVDVATEGVRWGREQLARSQRMIASGSLAPVELAASEAELQRRIDTWYSTLGILTEVENHLKTLLTPDRHDVLWNEEIVPADAQTGEPLSDLRAAVTRAIEQRPELRQIGERNEVNEVQKKAAFDQTRPQVNLVASYVSAGLGGSVREGENPISASQIALYQRLNQLSVANGLAPLPAASFGSLPEVLIGGYGTALSNVFSTRYPSVQVGLAIDFNLKNRTAEANLAQTAIAERRLKLEKARAEQAIEFQVRNALQAIETARQRIAAAEASARAAKEKLDSETRLFQSGESTNFLVLTRQNEYLDSRRRAVVAHLDFNKAAARLEQAMGGTLKTHNISLK